MYHEQLTSALISSALILRRVSRDAGRRYKHTRLYELHDNVTKIVLGQSEHGHKMSS